MIKVENLRKIYNPEKKSSSVGLYHVTFTLPSKGMVFVVGKSGSGKSTLLNILGGLDSSSGGTIIVDGNDFSNFTEKDFDNYRNTYLGFIFQDFHLIESLTIKENIKLALDLQGVRKSKKRIKEVLELVELEGYENRYPKELSGGQQQRVAIARAIVKKPKLILADEPTGNLDSKTSKHVMDVLKDISKETLVVVVSHNDEDAQFYADRIIELSDGRVIRDVERKSEEETKLISNNTINIPYNRKLTKEEQITVNNALKTGKYKLTQQTDPFTKTKKVKENEVKVKLKSKRMKISNVARLSNRFSKGYRGNSILTAVLMAFLVILLAVCQTFSSFNGDYLLQDAISYSEDNNYILNKGIIKDTMYPILNRDYVSKITDEEIEKFYEDGYQGNIYKLYNKYIPLSNGYQGRASVLENLDYKFDINLYADQGEGVLHCDEQFLINKYGIDGKLDVLAGSLDPSFRSDSGLILTDYAADCILNNYPSYQSTSKLEPYRTLIGSETVNYRLRIKAIINTNYKERYSELFENANYIDLIENSKVRKNEIEKMQKSDIYYKFVQEVNDYLTIGYYLGDMNCKDYVFQRAALSHAAYMVNNYEFVDENNNSISGNSYLGFATDQESRYSLNEGEIIIPYFVYNSIFGGNISSSDVSQIVNKKVTLNIYDLYSQEKEEIVMSKEFTIAGIDFQTNNKDCITFSEEDYNAFADTFFFTRALYFDNAESITSIFTPSLQDGIELYIDNVYFEAVYKIMDIVIIFNELFLIIVIGLIFISISLMMGYSRRSVKRKQLDIGILKCIGGENKHLFQIFFFQSIVITLGIIILSTTGMLLFDGVINKLLINSLLLYLRTDIVKDIVLIKFDYLVFLMIDIGILLITLFTSSSILSVLEKMKPINIIRNKNKGLLEK